MFGLFRKEDKRVSELQELVESLKKQIDKDRQRVTSDFPKNKPRGPGKKKEKNAVEVHFYVTEKQKDTIKRIANDSNRSVSDLLREWTKKNLDDEKFRVMSSPKTDPNTLANLMLDVEVKDGNENQQRYEDGFYDHWVRDRIKRNLAAHKKRYNSFLFEKEIYDWVRSIPCQKTQRQMAYWKVCQLNMKFKQSASYKKHLDSKEI